MQATLTKEDLLKHHVLVQKHHDKDLLNHQDKQPVEAGPFENEQYRAWQQAWQQKRQGQARADAAERTLKSIVGANGKENNDADPEKEDASSADMSNKGKAEDASSEDMSKKGKAEDASSADISNKGKAEDASSADMSNTGKAEITETPAKTKGTATASGAGCVTWGFAVPACVVYRLNI